MAISIPKKLQKKAVNRNQLKRRTREAYRERKNSLTDLLVQSQQTLRIFLVYTTETLFTYHEIEIKIELILRKLKDKIQDKSVNQSNHSSKQGAETRNE